MQIVCFRMIDVGTLGTRNTLRFFCQWYYGPYDPTIQRSTDRWYHRAGTAGTWPIWHLAFHFPDCQRSGDEFLLIADSSDCRRMLDWSSAVFAKRLARRLPRSIIIITTFAFGGFPRTIEVEQSAYTQSQVQLFIGNQIKCSCLHRGKWKCVQK